MDQQHPDRDEGPSKSAKKREMKALQDLALKLGGMSEGELERFGLGAATREALLEVGRMKPSGARNRQIKFAAQFLTKEDLDPVHAWFEDRRARHAAENRHFHELERWRDRLVAEGDEALIELLVERPELDRQALRQLMLTARKEAEAGKPPAAARKLYKLLRDST
jgi:ribosome-associated protein